MARAGARRRGPAAALRAAYVDFLTARLGTTQWLPRRRHERRSRLAYEYVVLRCVPRVDREEFVNVGVVLHCQMADFLDVAWHVDRDRLLALDPRIDVDQVCESLAFVEAVCAGHPTGGRARRPSRSTQRFGFLKAPRSTVLQPGPVHGGVTTDPARQLERLLEQLVG